MNNILERLKRSLTNHPSTRLIVSGLMAVALSAAVSAQSTPTKPRPVPPDTMLTKPLPTERHLPPHVRPDTSHINMPGKKTRPQATTPNTGSPSTTMPDTKQGVQNNTSGTKRDNSGRPTSAHPDSTRTKNPPPPLVTPGTEPK